MMYFYKNFIIYKQFDVLRRWNLRIFKQKLEYFNDEYKKFIIYKQSDVLNRPILRNILLKYLVKRLCREVFLKSKTKFQLFKITEFGFSVRKFGIREFYFSLWNSEITQFQTGKTNSKL